jgi:glycosyltransferase involved in cell wall biosynthesis
MTLAILICTLPERFEKLKRLKNILEPQVERFKDRVSIHINDAGESVPTGTKRNLLIEQSSSDYFCFVDDDDYLHAYYVDEIIKGIDQNPDVVTFCGYITTNGHSRTHWEIKLGNKYEERRGVYYRFPNHLAVMKRSLVRHIKFPDIWKQEDYEWAYQIHQRRLLKTEVHIPLELYHYDFDDTKPPYKNARSYVVR